MITQSRLSGKKHLLSNRLGVLQLVFLIAFLGIIIRLFYWQIWEGPVLSAQAKGQYEYRSEVTASRGSILASDNSWLATSGQAWTVAASIPEIQDEKRKIADELAPFFSQTDDEKEKDHNIRIEEDRLYSLLTKEKIMWTPLKARITKEVKQKIEDLDIKGIHFEPEEIRIYPEASSAAHLLGFVGKNETSQPTGYFGLEGYYDTTLTSKSGFVSREADPFGAPILLGESREVSAKGGLDLVTFIDKALQIDLDRKLLDGIQKYGAKSGSAIIMNPENGAIYAMSSYPSYNPGSYWEFGNSFFANPAISGTFEPGSVFKVLVMAAGLDSGVITPQTQCDICNGPYHVDKYLIETWNKEYHPRTSMTDVIVHSDNVGMVYVANRLGKERLYDYIQKFGIGEKTGIDLQGEMVATLRDKKEWGPVEQATASFGQGVAVTPMQMLRSVGAIANRGVMVRPHVVDKITSGSWEREIQPEEGVRVISEKAASEITQMMVEAANSGESKRANVKSFHVAGKTGTAQIPIHGYYDETKTIASFVGFAPYENPKFVMLVTLQEPQTSQWASETAAPLWYSIAKDLFLHFRIQPKEEN